MFAQLPGADHADAKLCPAIARVSLSRGGGCSARDDPASCGGDELDLLRRGTRLSRAGSAARSGSPAGRRPAAAACPAIDGRYRVLRLGVRQRAQQRDRVRMARLGQQRARRRPSSTICPPYITATRSHISAITPRSWLTRIMLIPKSRCSSSSRLRIWSWMITSSAVVGSSARRILGLRRERHGDQHALPHAAAELVRVVAHAARRRRDADALHQGPTRVPPVARAHAGRALRPPPRSGRRPASPGSARSSGPGRSSRCARRAAAAARPSGARAGCGPGSPR